MQELDSAKRVIADLEDELKAERANLRALTTEQNRLQRSKAEVLSQLQRTEAVGIWPFSCNPIYSSSFRTWRTFVNSCSRSSKKITIWKKSCEVSSIFGEFWYLTIGVVNATAEQKARILEGRVTENLETIEQLRHERSLLAADHKQLQRRFTELTEVSDSYSFSTPVDIECTIASKSTSIQALYVIHFA